jgi:2-polyprenyl-6-methoxyphenol hydroxylase-like FAD-dependent oxidoreductase
MRQVLISGAGVAGSALAYWLHRNGMRVTVVERAPAVRPGGLPVDFRGSAMTVLDRMGILDELRTHATGTGDMTVVDATGAPLWTMPAEVFTGSLEVPKEELTRILYELTAPGIEYVFADSVRTITDGDDGVLVEFERGEPRTFDLVVGADGVHSAVRRLVFDEHRQSVQSLGSWFATFALPNYLDLDYAGVAHFADDRGANVIASRHNTQARALLAFPAPHRSRPPRDLASWRQLLAEAFAGFGWEVPRLLAEFAEGREVYCDEMAQVLLPSWSWGRTVLLGDAGYCASLMSGRGTSQAIIGAYVLAGELAAHDDHTAAFDAYERQLREYVRGNQLMAWRSMRLHRPADDVVTDDVPIKDYALDLTVL